MVEKYRESRLPEAGAGGPEVDALRQAALNGVAGFREHFEAYRFDRGLSTLWEVIRHLNRFLVRQEPWKLAADPAGAERLDEVLYHAAQGLALVAHGLSPVLPTKATELWKALGGAGEPADRRFAELGWDLLPPGSKLRRGDALFPRVDKKAFFASTKEDTVEHETSSKSAAPATEASGETDKRIGIEQFMSVDLRVARVIVAEKIEGADKLLRLEVDLGGEKRQIVAGVALKYAPEELVDKLVVVVANLKPAKLRGVESQGMLLAADLGGVPIVATFEEPVEPGTRVR